MIDITKTITELLADHAEEIQRTPQPTSVRLGDQHLSNFQMQRTQQRGEWVCSATLPCGLDPMQPLSSACILTWPELVLEAVACDFRCIQTRPAVAGLLQFSVIHKDLPQA